MAWYRKAADQGFALAQFKLGQAHSTGTGVQQDKTEAYKREDLAATLAKAEDRQQITDARDALAKTISAAQLAEAQKRASDWMAAFEKRRVKASR